MNAEDDTPRGWAQRPGLRYAVIVGIAFLAAAAIACLRFL